jgi:hypothetical protein
MLGSRNESRGLGLVRKKRSNGNVFAFDWHLTNFDRTNQLPDCFRCGPNVLVQESLQVRQVLPALLDRQRFKLALAGQL